MILARRLLLQLRMNGEVDQTQKITTDLSQATESLNGLAHELFLTISPENFARLMIEAMDLSQMEIVRRYGFRKADVSECLRGLKPHAKVRQAIARELNLDPEALWP